MKKGDKKKSNRTKRVPVYLNAEEYKKFQQLRAKLIAKGSNFGEWVRMNMNKEV